MLFVLFYVVLFVFLLKKVFEFYVMIGSDCRNYEINYVCILKFLFLKMEVNLLKDFWIGYNLIYCYLFEIKC